MKYITKIEDKEIEVLQTEQSWRIDGKAFQMETAGAQTIISIRNEQGEYQQAVIQDIDLEKGKVIVQIAQKEIEVEITDPIDQKMLSLGIDIKKLQKAKNIKAPMPGLILKTLVQAGQSIKAGEPLFVLEAMKMENIFKAPDDVTIKEILIKEGDTVDKNQELISFG